MEMNVVLLFLGKFLVNEFSPARTSPDRVNDAGRPVPSRRTTVGVYSLSPDGTTDVFRALRGSYPREVTWTDVGDEHLAFMRLHLCETIVCSDGSHECVASVHTS